MNSRILRALLIASLLATFGTLAIGCGEDASDPAGDTANNGGVNNDVNNDQNNDVNNDDNNDVNNDDNNAPNNDNNDPPPNNDPNNNPNNDPNNNPNNDPNNQPGECENLVYVGQVFDNMMPTNNDGSPNPNGGVPVFTDNYGDAGLGALLDALPEIDEDDEDTPDVVENAAAVDIQLTDVTVVASSFNSQGQFDNSGVYRANREFWLQDASGAVKVFFFADAADSFPGFNIKVGQKVSVRVTEVTNFRGIPEITAADGASWALSSENNEVFVDDRTGGDITLDDVNKLIRVSGTIANEGNACGDPSVCYDLDYGGANLITLRSRPSMFIDFSVGSCVTYVGPVGAFAGVAQIDVPNFDWLVDSNQQ